VGKSKNTNDFFKSPQARSATSTMDYSKPPASRRQHPIFADPLCASRINIGDSPLAGKSRPGHDRKPGADRFSPSVAQRPDHPGLFAWARATSARGSEYARSGRQILPPQSESWWLDAGQRTAARCRSVGPRATRDSVLLIAHRHPRDGCGLGGGGSLRVCSRC
jgi:hypothetical protein